MNFSLLNKQATQANKSTMEAQGLSQILYKIFLKSMINMLTK